MDEDVGGDEDVLGEAGADAVGVGDADVNEAEVGAEEVDGDRLGDAAVDVVGDCDIRAGLTHHAAAGSPARRTSRGRASTVSCRRAETVPQSGHAAAAR